MTIAVQHRQQGCCLHTALDFFVRQGCTFFFTRGCCSQQYHTSCCTFYTFLSSKQYQAGSFNDAFVVLFDLAYL